jgi:Ni,Fe-hydrogenase I small subunit
MTKQETRRKAIGQVLNHLRDLCEDDDVAVSALEAAWELLDPEDRPNKRKIELVRGLEPRWLHCHACIGGQEEVEDSDEPDNRIVIDLDLGLFYEEGLALIAEIQRQLAIDPEAQWIALTIEGTLEAQWTEGGRRCSGPPMAPMLREAIRVSKEFAPDEET